MPQIVDLTGNKTDGKDDPPPRQTRAKKTTSRKSTASETDLKARLTACLDRIVAAATARGDEELAEILAEDRDIIVTALVSLTRPFRALRTPLVLLLGIVEPLMAFARLARLMAERIMTRRMERHETPAE